LFDQTAFGLRGAALQARSGAIVEQRDRLSQAASIAGAMGRQDVVEQLVAQIEDLNVQLFENAAAIRANTVAARQAQIDQITGRGGFLTGVSGGLQGIIQTIAQTTGALDIARSRTLIEQASAVLQDTGRALRDQLDLAFGVDLRGLTGQGLVDALTTLNIDGVEASLSVDQRTQFESLINAIIENAGAVATNTQSLKELNASVEQSFSSTAWQLFRQAIFTGSGGLLPQYHIPHAAMGGFVAQTGMAVIHQGETITRAGSSAEQYHLHVSNPSQVLDPGYVMDVMAFKRSTARAVS
jgi:hypothetical protein